MITKFKIFENIDIDPYGEEEWNDDKDINAGDTVELIDNVDAALNYGPYLWGNDLYLTFDWIKKGSRTKVIGLHFLDGVEYLVINFSDPTDFFNAGLWRKEKFKKIN